MSVEVCAFCGGPTSGGSINGRPFCSDPVCINAVIGRSVREATRVALAFARPDTTKAEGGEG